MYWSIATPVRYGRYIETAELRTAMATTDKNKPLDCRPILITRFRPWKSKDELSSFVAHNIKRFSG